MEHATFVKYHEYPRSDVITLSYTIHQRRFPWYFYPKAEKSPIESLSHYTDSVAATIALAFLYIAKSGLPIEERQVHQDKTSTIGAHATPRRGPHDARKGKVTRYRRHFLRHLTQDNQPPLGGKMMGV